MLVCSVSQLRRRAAIPAGVVEAAAAADATATGNVVFATLVDDPASVGEHVDAFLGQIMLEAASAASTVTAGLAYAVSIVEAVTATDVSSAAAQRSATLAETVVADSVQDATKTTGGAVSASVAETATAADLVDAVAISAFNGVLAPGGPIMPANPQPTVIYIEG